MAARLAPWLAALRRFVRLPQAFGHAPTVQQIRDAVAEGVVWLDWAPPKQRGSAQQHHEWGLRAWEALELLELLRLADAEQWQHALSQLWAEQIRPWLNEIDWNKPPPRLGCAVGSVWVSEMRSWCARFVLDDVSCVVSDDYKRLRQELESALQRRGQSAAFVPVRIEVRSSGDGDGENLASRVYELLQLCSTHAMRERVYAEQAITTALLTLFRLVEVDIERFNDTLRAIDCQRLRQIAACGVRFRRLSLWDFRVAQLNAVTSISYLQQLLAVSAVNRATQSLAITPCTSAALDEVECADIRPSVRLLDSSFSALLMSQSIRDVTIDMLVRSHDSDDRRLRLRLWQWIALAFFNTFAANEIQHVSLSALELADAEFAAFEQVLLAEDPLSVLFPSSTPRDQNLRVTASRVRLEPPPSDESDKHDAKPPLIVQFKSPIGEMHVLDDGSDDREWVRVLLPGWGQAWVRSSDASTTHQPAGTAPRSRSPQGLSLMFVSDSNIAVSTRLLRVIGHDIKKLRFFGINSPEAFTEEVLRDACRSCPLLEELAVNSAQAVSLEMYANVYRDGFCRASRLEIEFAQIEDETSVSRFFEQLADNAHPMASCLRSFSFHGHVSYWPTEMTQLIQKWLHHNPLLGDVVIDVNRIEPDASVEENNHQDTNVLGAYDYCPIAVRLSPLRLKAKLAVLSVARCDASPVQPAPEFMKFLDQRVLSKIFEFAAVPRSRRVIFHIGCPNDSES